MNASHFSDGAADTVAASTADRLRGYGCVGGRADGYVDTCRPSHRYRAAAAIGAVRMYDVQIRRRQRCCVPFYTWDTWHELLGDGACEVT